MSERVDLSGFIGSYNSRDAFYAWKEALHKAGDPRDVSVTFEEACELRRFYGPTDFRPLDSDTFQLPFLRLHVLR